MSSELCLCSGSGLFSFHITTTACVRFVAKPDSPCIYMEGNSGPDGCAIFYRGDKFSCESWHSRVLQVWRVESNQVSWDWRGAAT